jgi:type III restriction enzyme
MQLKAYQLATLDILKRYLEEASLFGPREAFTHITKETPRPYRADYRPLEGLPQVPYVCLRLPTGGGKTLLGTHAIAVARDSWVGKDYPLVLWLVPSNTIRLQTVEALRDTRHAYRQALDNAFDGRVRVFDIADFPVMRPNDIADNCCIIVGTIQALRVSNTEGRKVYAHHEDLEAHFAKLTTAASTLERTAEGTVKFSFANLLHMHRPLMIVDEAHNAVTGLTREMQTRVNPCAVIEFTATPQLDSNILHSVSAQALKREEMIKLPIILAEHDTWQSAVSRAVAERASLAKAAADEPDYIRPIVLFQAQPKNQEVTHEVLKKHLIEAEQVDENRIAVATGDQRELDGIDLFDPKCPIEYVITVEALKEGWDCSFAYVFCSLSRIKSATDVEQLLGRVLRMPYARMRKASSLNRAYAHVSETQFGQSAQALTDKLVAMGFEEEEARQAIVQEGLEGLGLFGGRTGRAPPAFSYVLKADLQSLEPIQSAPGLVLRAAGEGVVEVQVKGSISAALEQHIAAALPAPERGGFATAVNKFRLDTGQPLSIAEARPGFVVPRLMAWVQGELVFAETDRLMEYFDWRLASHPALLNASEFDIHETTHSFQIDLDGKRVVAQFLSEEEQLVLDAPVAGWTPENLVLWLDRKLKQIDVSQSDMLAWLRQAVGHLVQTRKLPVGVLMRAKFVLATKFAAKISAARLSERGKVYQTCLLAPEARVEVSFDQGFRFVNDIYADAGLVWYRGRYKFVKHYLGPDQVAGFDGAETGEEFQCAQIIDSLPQVRFWLRNVPRHPNSFRLPTRTDNFYPDFVGELNDGRFFAVEYKGEPYSQTDDSNEKRTIGALWARSTNGKGVFVMVEKIIVEKDVRSQLIDHFGGRK